MPDPVAAIRAIVARHLAQHGLRRALVAFSGGPDSTVLADACAAALTPAAVVLLHIDHGAAHSTAATAHCVRFAAAHGLTLRTARIAVPAGASWEAQARVARYRALRALAGESGDTGELILTAHTASDQAETVLLQLLRGTGPAGLAGVARRRGPFLRPLLEVSRVQILAYLDLAATDLTAWRDPMNEDQRFTRVRVRQELMPLFTELNPQAEAALCRLAAAAAEERAVLDAAAAAVLRAATTATGLTCAPVAAAPAPIGKRALAIWLRARREISARHLDALAALCRGPDAGTRGLDLAGGRVERVYGELRADPVGPAGRGPSPALAVSGPDGPYRVRTLAPGDRMRPARLRGRSRKLADLYIDLRVPRADRVFARVVERADGTIVWAEHVGAAHATDITVLPDLAARSTPG